MADPTDDQERLVQPEVLASIIGPLLTAVLAGSAVVLRAWQARRTRQDEAEELALHTERAVADLEFLCQQMTLELHHPSVHRRRFTACDAL